MAYNFKQEVISFKIIIFPFYIFLNYFYNNSASSLFTAAIKLSIYWSTSILVELR